MNILHVVFLFKIGGIQKLLIDITDKLVMDKNNNVYLCVINDGYDIEFLKKINTNVKLLLLDRKEKGKKFKYIFRYTKFIIENKIDIIHCHLENSVKFSVLAKILRPKLKIFLTVHDTNIFAKLKFYEVFIDKIICRKIIAISDVVKEEILARGVPEKKVVRIYNCVDINNDVMLHNKRKKFNSKCIVIGSVARIMPSKKGQDILIKAIGELRTKYPYIKCMFAGGPPEDKPYIMPQLLKLCNEENVTNNIKFLGNIYDVKKFLRKIDIFVLPSNYEGFGISLLEAMAEGIPCIASDIDGPKEIIKNDEYGLLFKKGDPHSLAQKIEYRIKNIYFDAEKINKYVIENFSTDVMIEKLISVYKC